MAEQNRGYKFLPYSLQKLTDLDPLRKSETYSREMNVNKLKEDILRNIITIFTSKSHLYHNYVILPDDIKSSVICYGLDDYAGQRISDDVLKFLEKNIIQQLKYFEPRINPKTIQIEKKVSNSGYNCDFIVYARLNVNGLNEVIKFQTNFSFETGLKFVK